MTLAVNATGLALTGADRRRLGRLYRRHRKVHRAVLAATFGPEAGALDAREDFRRRERALSASRGSDCWAYFLACRSTAGDVFFATMLPPDDPATHLARRHPLVKF